MDRRSRRRLTGSFRDAAPIRTVNKFRARRCFPASEDNALAGLLLNGPTFQLLPLIEESVMSIRIKQFGLAFAIFVLATTAFGQSDRGTITGAVTDQSGAVIPGVPVTATNTAT